MIPRAAAVEALPHVLRRAGEAIPVLAASLVLAGQLLLPGDWRGMGWLLLVAALLVGLPHGAVDHLVPAWVSLRRLPRRAVVGIAAGYAAAAAAALGVFRVAPLVALGLFLGLSVLHFGAGELTWVRLRDPGRVVGVAAAWKRAVAVFAWGGVAVLIPLVRWPDEVAPVLNGLAPHAAGLLSSPIRLALGAAVLAAVAVTVVLSGLRRDRRAAGELLLLTGVMVTVPPLAAFAVYFGCWHALRHLLRLLALDPGNIPALTAGRVAVPVRRFARQAAAPTAASLAVLAGLWWTNPDAGTFLSSDLTLLAALTVPHLAVVGWLDRQTKAMR